MAVPAGFERHFRQSPLTEPWEPLYSRVTDDAVIIGLQAGPQHANSRGLVHGGLISALADNAMGLSCARRLDWSAPLITVSLSIDFLVPARPGQWLEFVTHFARLGSTLCFAECSVTADDADCARARGAFRRTERPAADV